MKDFIDKETQEKIDKMELDKKRHDNEFMEILLNDSYKDYDGEDFYVSPVLMSGYVSINHETTLFSKIAKLFS